MLLWSLQWGGCLLALTGAVMVASNSRVSRFGFLFFLAGNVAWVSYGILINAPGLVTKELGFTLINMLGVWSWFLRDRFRTAQTGARV